jgi:uncharacterized membrane protein YhaH (DUF805 family)
MDFVQATKTCFEKYATFEGRAGRPEFWWFFLAQFLIMLVASMLGDILSAIAALALVLPGLAVGARRLHDIGKSGWFLLLGLIPFIGFLVLLYFFVQPSGPANSWGAGPAGAAAKEAMPPGTV